MTKRFKLPSKPVINPDPSFAYRADIQGAVLVGNAERRLERFDTGWEVTFAASWGDGKAKLLCWKVYPKPETEVVAVDQVLRRAKSIGIRQVAFVLFNKPEVNQ